MFISQTALGLLYLYGAILGASAGALYDFFRITRIFFGVHYSRSAAEKLKKIQLPLLPPYKEHEESPILGVLVFLQDFFFCIFSGIALAILFYEANDGVIRPPVLLAFAAGFFLYRQTLSRLTMAISEILAFFLESAVRYLWFFLSYPFRVFGKLLVQFARVLILKIQSRARVIQRARFYRCEKCRLDRGMGLFPGTIPPKTKQKRGKTDGNSKKETVQPLSRNSDLSRDLGSAFGGRIRHQHYEVQSTTARGART